MTLPMVPICCNSFLVRHATCVELSSVRPYSAFTAHHTHLYSRFASPLTYFSAVCGPTWAVAAVLRLASEAVQLNLRWSPNTYLFTTVLQCLHSFFDASAQVLRCSLISRTDPLQNLQFRRRLCSSHSWRCTCRFSRGMLSLQMSQEIGFLDHTVLWDFQSQL